MRRSCESGLSGWWPRCGRSTRRTGPATLAALNTLLDVHTDGQAVLPVPATAQDQSRREFWRDRRGYRVAGV